MLSLDEVKQFKKKLSEMQLSRYDVHVQHMCVITQASLDMLHDLLTYKAVMCIFCGKIFKNDSELKIHIGNECTVHPLPALLKALPAVMRRFSHLCECARDGDNRLTPRLAKSLMDDIDLLYKRYVEAKKELHLEDEKTTPQVGGTSSK